MHVAPARPLRIPMVVAVLLVIGSAVASAQHTTYRVVLNNGNEIISKYKPVEASYDPNKMILMTEQSNIIALHKDDIQDMVAVVEQLGFGRRLNDTTVVVGNTANDAPTQEELQEMQANFDAMFPGIPLDIRSGMSPQVQAPIFSEPGEAGRGIPIGFVSGAQPSLGNFPLVQPPPR